MLTSPYATARSRNSGAVMAMTAEQNRKILGKPKPAVSTSN